LENQLFEYSFARAVAERTRTKLRFDLSYFGLEPHRDYALGDFHIRADVVTGVSDARAQHEDPALEDRYARERFGASVLREDGPGFDPGVIERAGRANFLSGYWQSEGYFADVAPLIRIELRPRPTANIERGLEKTTSSRCAVAVHVRRGDLVADPDMTAIFGVTGPEYFQPAAEEMLRSHPAAEFFVFSDDPEWCAGELELPGPTTIISGDNAPFEDLALMASCDHAIISASSFAWWGAWLGETENSLIIAPAAAFTGTKDEPAGYFPDRWRRF
jgi:hypothetical protein